MTAVFAPVPLPGGITWDGTTSSVTEGIATWIGSEAMSALIAEFGQRPLPDGPLGERLVALESISDKCWEFRRGRERNRIEDVEFPADLAAHIKSAAAALGLADRETPESEIYDHVLVLGGGVATMAARADLAASVLRRGVRTATVAGLGSVRPLDNQAQVARDLGMPECLTEGDAVDAGLRRAFGLGQPSSHRSGISDIGQPWWIRSYDYAPPVVHVLSAPVTSTEPGARANTGDTLIGWAELVEPSLEGSRLLVVTSDIYVPFQHCDAIRLLGLPYNCLVDTIGFSTANAPKVGPPRTAKVLQEIRSAVRSMQALHAALK